MKPILAVCTIILLAFSACSPWMGDEVSFTITIGGNVASDSADDTSARSALDKWDENWDPNEYMNYLTHVITLTNGPGPDQIAMLDGSKKTERFFVAAGNWTITVKSYLDYDEGTGEGVPVAEFSKTINIYHGIGTIPIQMEQPEDFEVARVVFDSNWGATSDITTTYVPVGAKVQRPVDPERDYHIFNGWYKDTALTESWYFDSDTVTGNINLYAKWTSLGFVTYTSVIDVVYFDGITLADVQLIGDYEWVTPGTLIYPGDNQNFQARYNNEHEGNIIVSVAPATITSFSVSGTVALSPITGNNTAIISITVVPDSAVVTLVNSPTGITFNSASNTLTYNGTAVFANPSVQLTFKAELANYNSEETTLDINVYDGQANYTGADGTFDRRIRVNQANITQFNTYANTTTGLTRHYVLTQDVTLTGSSNWTRIGQDTGGGATFLVTRFSGTFDGGFNRITGLTIASGTGQQGMFGAIGAGSIVKNLGLRDVSIIVTGDRVGGIVGVIVGGIVQNCNVTGSVQGQERIGGIAGSNENAPNNNFGLIENCHSAADVRVITGTIRRIGGIVGFNGSTVRNCYFTGTVNSTGNSGSTNANLVGGIVGAADGSRVVNCYAVGSVSVTYTTNPGTGHAVGGIVGGTSSGAVTYNCVALNSSISISDIATSVSRGRVIGMLSSEDNNYGRNDLDFFGGIPGEPIDFPPTTEWWETAGNWRVDPNAAPLPITAWDFNNVWIMDTANGSALPELRNMPPMP